VAAVCAEMNIGDDHCIDFSALAELHAADEARQLA
jgi:hypothetical protein